MNCDDFCDLFELWVLGALEPEEQDEIVRHLRGGCENCLPLARRAAERAAFVSESVPLVQPPERLRRKIQMTFAAPAGEPARNPRPRWVLWPLVAALAASLALAGFFFVQEQKLRNDLASLKRQDSARMAVLATILQASSTREVSFGPPRPTTPRGSVFVHPTLGIVLVAGDLGAAPAGWKYETWVVPASGSPRAIEGWLPDSGGRAISIVPGPVQISGVKAVAVSLEPLDASLEKPTKLVFAAPI